MPILLRKIAAFLAAGVLLAVLAGCGGLAGEGRGTVPLSSALVSQIKAIGSTPGAPLMMRIFKTDSVLEVWKQTSGGDYALLKTYTICAWSGGLGPKIAEGDRQAPEGFYDITPGLMNPKSNYFLAINTGFPNKFDRAHGRTGADLMVHGDCSSSGCYAMTDKEIADLYALVREAFAGGNRSVQMQIFPFRMTSQNLAKVAGNANLGFWQNIKAGYDAFEATKRPPRWDVCGGKYVFNAVGADGQPLDASSPCPALKTVAALGADAGATGPAVEIAALSAAARVKAPEATALRS